MILVQSPAWAKGFADGCNGLPQQSKAFDYAAGWFQAEPYRRKFDNGCSNTATGFAAGVEQTEDRRQTIINQVRGAANKEQYSQAMKAAYMFDLVLWQSLDSVYGVRYR